MHIQTALKMVALGWIPQQFNGQKMEHTTFMDWLFFCSIQDRTGQDRLIPRICFWVTTSGKSPARNRIIFQRRLPGAHEDINLINRKGNETAKNKNAQSWQERAPRPEVLGFIAYRREQIWLQTWQFQLKKWRRRKHSSGQITDLNA